VGRHSMSGFKSVFHVCASFILPDNNGSNVCRAVE
jgi:hypothetical protein